MSAAGGTQAPQPQAPRRGRPRKTQQPPATAVAPVVHEPATAGTQPTLALPDAPTATDLERAKRARANLQAAWCKITTRILNIIIALGDKFPDCEVVVVFKSPFGGHIKAEGRGVTLNYDSTLRSVVDAVTKSLAQSWALLRDGKLVNRMAAGVDRSKVHARCEQRFRMGHENMCGFFAHVAMFLCKWH